MVRLWNDLMIDYLSVYGFWSFITYKWLALLLLSYGTIHPITI